MGRERLVLAAVDGTRVEAEDPPAPDIKLTLREPDFDEAA